MPYQSLATAGETTREPPELAAIPEAPAEAARFDVPADIHARDFVYQFHLEVQPEPESDKARADVTEYYFRDGHRSATRLDALIRQHHPDAGGRRLTLFEFASGYGCVSRHLARMDDRYDLVACDIHQEAATFLRQRLGVEAVLSHSSPAGFAAAAGAEARFDVVFALSFFSHMPDSSFGAWLDALFATLAPGGVLIFTTHGQHGHDYVGNPALDPRGFWFTPLSEQKDLPTEEYGSMIATPLYVMERIARLPGATLLAFQDGFWWGKQDVYVVRRSACGFQPDRVAPSDRETEQSILQGAIETIRGSTSWRVTAPLRAVGRVLRRP